MNIQLAIEDDIPYILEIIKQRCEWFREKKIEQWGDWYYTELYNMDYFRKMMQKYQLYIVKLRCEIIGVFLLKDEDIEYWKDEEKAYYIHHFVTKIGYPGLGDKILDFIENLAKQNDIGYLRLDCMKSNQKLNQYYKNHGFGNKGEGENPYPYKLWERKVN